MNKWKILKRIFLCQLLTGCANTQTSINDNLSKEEPTSLESKSDFIEQSESSEVVDMKYKRVILIGVDGAGSAFSEEHTPNIMKIFNDYATTHYALSANPTISAQCWGSMLNGVIPSVHGFTNDSIASNKNTISDKYPSIFKKIRENYPKDNLASFCNWNPINNGIIEDDIGVYKDTFLEDGILATRIGNYINKNDFKMMFVQFDSVDHEGHSKGYGSKEYYATLKKIDDYVCYIFETLYDLDMLEDTLFMITADHGGYNYSHGGYTDQEKYVFLGVRGEGVNKGTIGDCYIRDIPAIIAHYLNIDLGSSFDSYLPANLFKDELNPKTRQVSFGDMPKETPSLATLYSYIDKDSLKLYMNMDNSVENAVSSNNITYKNKIYYPEGVYSNGLNVSSEGYVSINDYKFNNEDFSLSMFVKINKRGGDPCIISNKDWNNGKNDGFALSLRDNDIKLNVGANGSSREDVTIHYPSNLDNFFNIMITYNAKTSTISLYINFSLESVYKCTNKINFDSSYPINIGQDGTGNYAYSINAVVDDLMIFDKTLSNEEIQRIKEYYQK